MGRTSHRTDIKSKGTTSSWRLLGNSSLLEHSWKDDETVNGGREADK